MTDCAGLANQLRGAGTPEGIPTQSIKTRYDRAERNKKPLERGIIALVNSGRQTCLPDVGHWNHHSH